MTDTQKIFINMLHAYIHDRPMTLIEGSDFEGLFKLADMHSVIGIYAAMNRKNKFPMSQEMAKKLDSYMLATVSQSVMWDTLYKEVSEKLANKGIINIVVKGPVIKKFYPDPDLRTMGDIDLVVHKNDIPLACKTMLEIGFRECTNTVDEFKFVRNNMTVEIHEDLTSEDFGTGVDYKKEMQYIFSCTKKTDSYVRELTDDCHLVYQILHIAHHLFSAGCGIRQILDVALTIKHCDIDIKSVLEKFDVFRLTELAHMIFYLCDKWFEVNVEDYEIDQELYNYVADHILSGGVFGFAAGREKNQSVRDSMRHSRIKFFLVNAFPNINIMRSYVIWFRNKPSILLPIAWVYRWITSYKDHSDRINYYIKKSITGDKQIKKEYEMLKKLGFYKDN